MNKNNLKKGVDINLKKDYNKSKLREQATKQEVKEMKYFEEVKDEIEYETMTFEELDNFMMANGYYSVFDDGITEAIKK